MWSENTNCEATVGICHESRRPLKLVPVWIPDLHKADGPKWCGRNGAAETCAFVYGNVAGAL
jgi:hypothetical protein